MPSDLGVVDAAPDLTPTPTLAIDPPSYVVPVGRTMTFVAKGATNWNVREGSSGGTVDAQGVYTAPMTPGTFGTLLVATVLENSILQIVQQ
jgi:hypothetical protein